MTDLATDLLHRSESTVSDEYERQVYNQSSTVQLHFAAMATYAICGMLAWILPGFYSLAALAPIGPLAFSQIVSMKWLRCRIPRPKPYSMHWSEITVYIAGMLALIFGIAYQINRAGLGHGVEILSYAIAGAGLVVLFTPFTIRHQRKADEQRIDARLEAEDFGY